MTRKAAHRHNKWTTPLQKKTKWDTLSAKAKEKSFDFHLPPTIKVTATLMIMSTIIKVKETLIIEYALLEGYK